MFHKKTWSMTLLLVLILNLMGCCSTKIQHSCPVNLRGYKMGVAPFNNHTETPLAGERAQNITQELLRIKGIAAVSYPSQKNRCDLIPGAAQPVPFSEVLAWARSRNLCYIMRGTVNEWRYKVGLDGEPVVGVAFEVVDTNTGCIIWNAVGSKSGGSRCALSGTAQSLINVMLNSLVWCDSTCQR